MPTPLNILILEDDQFDAELEITVLEKVGYACQWERVDGRADFLTRLTTPALDYDIILADYNLPDFDGVTALKLFLEHGLDIPFVLVSGRIGEETVVEILKAGATDCVLKDRLSRLGPVVKRALLEKEERQRRQRAERALRQSETYFRSLIENISDIITLLDADGTISFESPSVERVLGYKPDELIGQNVFDFIHADDLTMIQKAIARRFSTFGPVPPIEIRFRHKDGRWRTLEVIGGNLIDDAMRKSVVVTARDITARKQLEEQLRLAQKMEAVGQLTAGIAHDFNNLLTAINGFAELMQLRLSANDPLKEMIARISESGQRGANLIRQLMTFSRKQIVEPKVLDLNDVVNQIDKMLRRIIGEHIDLQTTLLPDLWPVKVDPAQFEQVIVNLAVNARDAMPDGGKLTIETRNTILGKDSVGNRFQTEPGDYVLLAVRDTGKGIDKDVQSRIFEPFFTTKEMGQGTGLGLAIVYGIVKQNGGDIQVHSKMGQGTTFKVYLPRATEAPILGARLESLTTLPTGHETVLLVEDAAGVRDLAAQILQMQGYKVLEARDGQEALQVAAHYTDAIHLLLTDVVMPGISGKALAKQLSQRQPELKVLYMSGYTDDVIAHQGVLDPDMAFLQKPFNSMALARKIRQVLDAPSKYQ